MIFFGFMIIACFLAAVVIGLVTARDLSVPCPICGCKTTLMPIQVLSDLQFNAQRECRLCGAILTSLYHAEYARRWPKKWRALKALPELRKRAIEFNKHRHLRAVGDDE